MKKIRFFIGTLSDGGAERVVSNLSLNMNKGIDKEIILFGDSARVDYPYDGELVYLDENKHLNFWQKISALSNRIRSIKKIKKDNPEITTISFLEYPNMINALTKAYGKSVVSVRNHMSEKHRSGIKALFWNLTIRYLYKKADRIIVVSKEIKKDLVENYYIDENKINVIYNSYPIDYIQELAKSEIEEEYKEIFKHPVIITSGRLNKQKGQWHLIKSFNEVKKSIPNAKLIILGDGPLKEELIQLVEELKLQKEVIFMGFQKNPFKYISRAKVFVLSSLHEGFPNALSEAMACGVPIISTDCKSGPREILAPKEFDESKINYDISYNRYGVLVPVFDGIKYGAADALSVEEEIMANQIINILNDEDKREYYSKQSLLRIQDFNIRKTVELWERVM